MASKKSLKRVWSSSRTVYSAETLSSSCLALTQKGQVLKLNMTHGVSLISESSFALVATSS